MNRFLRLINNVITSNIEGGYESEPVRKAVTINLFSFIGLFFMLFYATESFVNNNFKHALILSGFAVFTISLFLFLRKTKSYLVASHALILVMIVLEVYLLVTGGNNNTGILWLYIFPILCLFTVGVRAGIIYIIFIFSFIIIIFYLDHSFAAKYNPVLKSRFLSTFIAITFIAITIEFVRQKTYNELIESNNKKTFYLNKVMDQQKEIISKSEKLKKANKELEQHHNHLENLVKERTKELEIAKDKAEESDRLKSAFLANMSHEIRTPMNVIIGFSSLLVDPESDEDLKEEMALHIKQNINSLLKLIENIISISAIEAGQIEAKIVRVNINDLLKDIHEDFKNSFNTEKLNFIYENEFARYTVETNTDSHHLYNILSNLLDNAFKFTESGEIRFGFRKYTEDKKPYIQFYVKDTGIGLNEEQQIQVFNRFTKAVNSKKKLYRGAGLGLSICKNLVKLLGGKIWVESQPDYGSVFKFNIPFDTSEINEKTIHVKEVSFNEYNWKNKSVLIVDDEPQNYSQLKIEFTKTGVKVYYANNGMEAVNTLKNHNIDVVLMDIKMPVMNGLEATRVIRKDNPDIPIIAQTAFAMENDERACLEVACSAYLQKPIQKNQLFNILNKFLS